MVDPESGLDAIRNVGIRNGKVAVMDTRALRGASAIDATGLVVAPGFIDLHSHGQTDEPYRYQALDGVTTALEIGTADVDEWYRQRQPGRLINYGVSIGHVQVRMAVLKDPGTFLPSGDAAHRLATDAEVEEMKRRIEAGLKQGAVAVGFGVAYTVVASPWEILEMFRACHDETWTAAQTVLTRTGRTRFRIPEVLREMAQSGYAESTIRTHITSRCCINAPKNHEVTYPYFRRVGHEYELVGGTSYAGAPIHN